MPAKKGLYANIQAKRKRIAKGSAEKMRKPGEKGAPTQENFAQAEKTATKPRKKTKAKSASKAKPSGGRPAPAKKSTRKRAA